MSDKAASLERIVKAARKAASPYLGIYYDGDGQLKGSWIWLNALSEEAVEFEDMKELCFAIQEHEKQFGVLVEGSKITDYFPEAEAEAA